jgi:hypothetical protein
MHQRIVLIHKPKSPSEISAKSLFLKITALSAFLYPGAEKGCNFIVFRYQFLRIKDKKLTVDASILWHQHCSSEK